MVKRIGTHQRKTRHKFKRHYRTRGKISISQYFQELKAGDKVNLKINSVMQTGRFSPRFHGMTGTIVGRQGFCYEVALVDGHKPKRVFVHPIHLIKQLSKP